MYIRIYVSLEHIHAHGRKRYTRRRRDAIRGLAKICPRHSWASASNTSALNQSIVEGRPDSVQVDSPSHDKSFPFSFLDTWKPCWRRTRRDEEDVFRAWVDVHGNLVTNRPRSVNLLDLSRPLSPPPPFHLLHLPRFLYISPLHLAP